MTLYEEYKSRCYSESFHDERDEDGTERVVFVFECYPIMINDKLIICDGEKTGYVDFRCVERYTEFGLDSMFIVSENGDEIEIERGSDEWKYYFDRIEEYIEQNVDIYN